MMYLNVQGYLNVSTCILSFYQVKYSSELK